MNYYLHKTLWGSKIINLIKLETLVRPVAHIVGIVHIVVRGASLGWYNNLRKF